MPEFDPYKYLEIEDEFNPDNYLAEPLKKKEKTGLSFQESQQSPPKKEDTQRLLQEQLNGQSQVSEGQKEVSKSTGELPKVDFNKPIQNPLIPLDIPEEDTFGEIAIQQNKEIEKKKNEKYPYLDPDKPKVFVKGKPYNTDPFKETILTSIESDDEKQSFLEIENIYDQKGYISPAKKFYEYNTLLKQGVPKQQAASKMGLAYNPKDNSVNLYPEDKQMVADLYRKQYEKIAQEKAESEKNPYIKDVFYKVSAGVSKLFETTYNTLALVDPTGTFKYTADQMKQDAETLNAKTRQYDEDIINYARNGDYGKAIGSTVLNLAETTPTLIMLALGNAAGAVKTSNYLLGSISTGQKYSEIKDKDIPEVMKWVNSLNYGASEVVFNDIGIVPILKSSQKAINQLGKDVAEKEIKKIYSNQMERFLVDTYGSTSSILKEGASEWATKVSQNTMDKLTIDPNKNIMDGAGDAFVTGLVVGKALSLPVDVVNAKQYIRDRLKQLPEDFPIENKPKAAELLIEKDRLRKEELLDEPFKKDHTKRIENINSELKGLNKKHDIPLEKVDFLPDATEDNIQPLKQQEDEKKIMQGQESPQETNVQQQKVLEQPSVVSETKPSEMAVSEPLKTEKNAKTQQSGEMREQIIPQERESPSNKNLPEINRAELQNRPEVKKLEDATSINELDEIAKDQKISPMDKSYQVKMEELRTKEKETENFINEQLQKTRKEKLSEKEEEIKKQLSDRLLRLSGAKFALQDTPKNPDVMKDLFGVVSDLSQLGVVKIEQGIDHIVTELKKYLPHIDEQNIDKYKDDIQEFYIGKTNEEIDSEKIIKESEPKNPEINKVVSLNEEEWTDKIRRKVQNKYRRLDKFVEEAEKKGYSIIDEINPKLQMELLPGRSAKKVADIEEKVLKGKGENKSILQRAKSDNIDLDELGKFMLAKHSHERNLFKMEEINKELDKKIASTDNETTKKKYESQKIKQEEVDLLKKKTDSFLQKMKDEGKYDKYESYSGELREALIKDRQQKLVEYGLETQENIDNLNKIYPNYVPYKVLSSQKGKIGQSKKMDIIGKDIQRAKNLVDIEKLDRTNPIIQSLFDNQQTIIRGEKNKVDKSLYDLVNSIQTDDIEIVKLKHKPVFNSDGDIDYIAVDQAYKQKLQNESIELRVDGKPVFLKINDPQLLKTMKGLGDSRAVKGISKFNNYLRIINTIYNPEFLATNFIRDVQTAGINLASEDKKGLTRNFAKNIPKAMKGIYQNEKGNIDSEWSKTYEELKDLGGEVGWLHTEDIEANINKIQKSFNSYNSDKTSDKLKSALNDTAELLDRLNKVVEMSTRLSAYKSAVDYGMTKEQAAGLAKNLTVNFNKKGELGAVMDSFYLFANAGIQGSARLTKAMLTSNKGRMVAASIVASSFMINMLNSYIDEDEYEKIPEGIKERNLIIMTGDDKHPYIKIPLPYGYNIFKVMGDYTYDAIKGNKTGWDLSKGMLKSLDAAFNPVSSGTLLQMFSPTALDPVVQIGQNKTWFGGKLKPDQPSYQPKIPESQRYFSTTRGVSKQASEVINELTKGGKSAQGYIDISPEDIDLFWDFFTGGTGRFVMNIVETGTGIARDEISVQNIPFARQFIGTPSEKRDLGTIYSMNEEAWRKRFTPNQKEQFYKAVDSAYKNKLIEYKDKAKYKKDFDNGQRAVLVSKEYPKLTRDQVKEIIKTTYSIDSALSKADRISKKTKK